MNVLWRALALFVVCLTVRPARAADAHSNCMNQCLLTQVQCARPNAEHGLTKIEGCNQQYKACVQGCPPPSANNGGGGGSVGAAPGGDSGQPRIIIPEFPGNNSPLPPQIDTSIAEQDAQDAENERLRLAANFEAAETYRAMNKARDNLIALNHWLEEAARATGLNVHYSDPAPIPPPQLVPPTPLRSRRKANPAAGFAAPLPPMPPEFETSREPDQCKPAARPKAEQILGVCPGLGSIKAHIAPDVSVIPGCEDDKVYVEVTTQKLISMRFDLTFTALEGDIYQSSGSVGNVRAGATITASGSGPYKPFPAPPTGPKHVANVAVSKIEVVDINDAYQTFIKENPQCDPAKVPNPACYFDAWRYRVPCPTPTPAVFR